MDKRKIVDISTDEKKKLIFELFNNFTSKHQAYEYFGISDNKRGAEYLSELAALIGFDLTTYKTRRKKVNHCLECGKEITSKYGRVFCSSSCAAKYNNKHRDSSVYQKIANSLRKGNLPKCGKEEIKTKKLSIDQKQKFLEKKCELCGSIFKTKNNEARFCSGKCASLKRHEESYCDFLNNSEKYCRGNYTPKAFKKEFMNEQENKCAICGCSPEHNGMPLIFVLDHIDGDASNNKRDNLRLVCPNCDSQLPTFKSKNKYSTRRNYWKEHIFNNL